MTKHKFIASAILAHLLLFSNVYLSYGQEYIEQRYTLLLSGASFAADVNGWFEVGCETLGAKAINRAKGGTAIANMANQMAEGELYTAEELEELDALVIMHVVDKDVYNEKELEKSYKDYQVPFDRSNYAAAFDYVIKRYISDCYNLKYNEDSEYYNTEKGKPAVIVLTTNWHDGREIYNKSVRKLAHKWGLPLVEFDKNIGFSKQARHPVTGEHISLLYAKDKKTIDGGEVHGWHPLRGHHEYIQRRMGAIFASTMRSILPFP